MIVLLPSLRPALIVGIAARIRLTAFVAAVVARHAFAFAEDSTPTCQRQERTVGHDKPGLVS